MNHTYLQSISPVYSVPNGMPLSVFNNKYSRVKHLELNPDFDPEQEEGSSNTKMRPFYQNWEERITDVVEGNFSLDPRLKTLLDAYGTPSAANEQFFSALYSPESNPVYGEFSEMMRLAKQGVLPFAGRHLQHGDRNQYNKLGELFTNCSTAMMSWTEFFLLLKGSGVGRDYSSDICWVDWDYMPQCRFVLESPNQWGVGGHPDYEPWIESLQAARHKYDSESEHVRWFEVEDSAEGWVKVLQVLETAAFHKNNKDHLFIFDFSKIRPKGTPISGQQNRPASGPVPLIQALLNCMTVKGVGFKPWKQALFIDDYMASCVALGGVRRSARMATKYWKDRDVLEFIDIKREGFLRSANNSVLVDQEFWDLVRNPTDRSYWAVHARRVFAAATEAAYHDQTGEPGFINVDKLTWKDDGSETITADSYIDSYYADNIVKVHRKTKEMISYLLEKAKQKKYKVIVNPCSEIPIAVWGAYCVIGDVCGTYAKTKEELKTACVLMARSLMRVNLMKSLYSAEVRRTMRIGVGIIGIFEFAWNHFQINLKQILLADMDPDDQRVVDAGPEVYQRSLDFAAFIKECGAAVEKSVIEYAAEIGVNVPHTSLTLKPAGTVSKVMNSTEAANAPANNFYLRNNQYLSDDPQYHALRKRGYPWRDISHAYPGHHIIGFPTKQFISDLMGDQVVVAAEITPEEQYAWLRWLETHWLGGDGKHGQVSYTMKYYPERVSYQQFQKLLIDHQSTVRCCSWMQITDMSKFAYQPEEPITEAQYNELMSNIDQVAIEQYDEDALQCESGVCPMERNQLVFTDGSKVMEEHLRQ